MYTNNTVYSTDISVQQTFDQIERELGAGIVPRIFRLLESKPELLAHFWGQFRSIVLEGQLPRTLKEMVGMVVAASTHCEYVQMIHLHSLTLQGVAKEVLNALASGNYTSTQFNSLSQKVLQFAAMSVTNRAAYANSDSSDWLAMRHQNHQILDTLNLSQEEKIELVATVALFEQICTVANLFELDPSQP